MTASVFQFDLVITVLVNYSQPPLALAPRRDIGKPWS